MWARPRTCAPRVRSYLLESSQANAKTGSLMREAVDLEYILVGNETEALALETNLIKERKPRFNILLKDDKSYPYVKLTMADRFPKVFVTRRLLKDGAAYYGPYFPGSLAWRVVELIHRSFLIPSCKVDLSRYHPRACLQYYIHRCLGPCVEELTTPEIYKSAVRDARLLLEGRHAELERTLTARMMEAAEAEQFEAAARLRDQLSTVHQFRKSSAPPPPSWTTTPTSSAITSRMASLAVNLFHVRAGKIVDRREFFWEDLPESAGSRQRRRRATQRSKGTGFSLYIDESKEVGALAPEGNAGSQPEFHAGPGLFRAAQAALHRPAAMSRAPSSSRPISTTARRSAALLTERTGHRIEIAVPQRGEKRSLVDLAGQNAKQSYIQRFRVLEPRARRFRRLWPTR